MPDVNSFFAVFVAFDAGIDDGLRIKYPLSDRGDKLWIITEADRSSTCLLLPDEY